MFYLDILPIAFKIGNLSIYWYGIIYALSIFIIWLFSSYIIKMMKKFDISILSSQYFDQFMFIGIISCIIGARLGHILFFEPEYYINNPFEIFMIRNGGLSFHGGVLGILFSLFYFKRKYNIPIKIMADILSFSGALGIFIGRIANFINQELYGIVTNFKFAVIFSFVDNFPRHPTQIYESIFEGFVSFWIMLMIWKFKGPKLIGSGIFSATFMIVYSSSRFIIEFYKDVETYNYFNMFSLTVGQILSIILFIFAFVVLRYKEGDVIKN